MLDCWCADVLNQPTPTVSTDPQAIFCHSWPVPHWASHLLPLFVCVKEENITGYRRLRRDVCLLRDTLALIQVAMFLQAALLCSFLSFGTSHSQTRPVGTLPPDSQFRCEPIKDVNICLNMPWQNATFPNFREHETQADANAEISDFRQVIDTCTCCSQAIVHFLCAYYTPICIQLGPDGSTTTLQPCKSLCQKVRDGCEVVYQQSSLNWPPHLECENFPDNSDGMSICADFPDGTLVIPPSLGITCPDHRPTAPVTVTPSASAGGDVISGLPGATPTPSTTCQHNRTL